MATGSGTTTLIILKELAGNPSPHLNMIQTFLAPHVSFLKSFWIAVWILTAIVLVLKFWYEYKKQKQSDEK